MLKIFRTKTDLSAKYLGEVNFWKDTIKEYVDWYLGKRMLYGEKPPSPRNKIKGHTLEDSAILTWGKIHQEKKYLLDLKLSRKSFSGMKLLDIGSGPHPSAKCFEFAKLHCLDPLLSKYLEIGFPIHYYDNVKFIMGKSEAIPFPDNYFDAIISVNAIDHVDNIVQTAKEIRRVLKPSGKMRLHIHYHKSTDFEPIELNDKLVIKYFSWCKDFRKIDESNNKTGFTISDVSQSYTLWSNFK